MERYPEAKLSPLTVVHLIQFHRVARGPIPSNVNHCDYELKALREYDNESGAGVRVVRRVHSVATYSHAGSRLRRAAPQRLSDTARLAMISSPHLLP